MTLNGYDISAFQNALDPAQVPGDFVIVKVTGGDGYANPSARNQIAKARAAGKLVGIYHFARDGYTAATAASEADWFLRNAADLCDGNTLVVLDWEGDNATDVAYAKAWLDEVHTKTGVKPVIYMSFKDIKAADWSTVANADYGLWEAAYVLGYQRIDGYNPPAGLADIPYWTTRCMWQYTSVGHLNGWADNLDLDLFYGDATTWAAYARKNGVTTQSSASTPIEGFLMALSDADQAALVTNVNELVANVRKLVTELNASDPNALGDFLEIRDNLRKVVGTTNDIKAAGSTLTLTDAQVQALADKLNATLPAANLAALKAKL